MFDIVFKFNENSDLYISYQNSLITNMVKRIGISHRGVNVKSQYAPVISRRTLFIRGECEEYNERIILSNKHSNTDLRVFICAIIAIMANSFNVGIDFNGDIRYVSISRCVDLIDNNKIYNIYDSIYYITKIRRFKCMI